jgi:Fe-S-cluster-containing hydrogenase component 2
MEACCGCGVCEAVCPEAGCITMVSETSFNDNASQWEAWRKDPDTYARWVAETIAKRPEDRSHGFRYLGQYQQQVPGVLETARQA